MGNKVRIPGKRCISLMNLEQYGWNKSFEELFLQYAAEGCLPGRVVVHKGEFHVISSVGLLHCHATGRLKFLAAGAENLPAVGDWVAVKAQPGESSGTVVGVLPRKGRVIRRASGTRTDAQVVAANVDVVFLVSSLDDEFNPARIERYLVMASESGAAPIVVLHKSDLAIDLDEARQIIADLAPGIPLLVTSIVTDEGLEELRAVLRPGITGVLLGSSGVGKSTILNRLVGSEHMRTSEVRETDSHGRHTTTHRELVLLPGGGMLIDTPGMREIQLWGDGPGLQDAFDDVEEIGLQCKFTNCQHDTEPDCAVLRAIEDGLLEADRLTSYRKLQRELAHVRAKQDVRERMLSKQEQKKRSTELKRIQRRKGL